MLQGRGSKALRFGVQALGLWVLFHCVVRPSLYGFRVEDWVGRCPDELVVEVVPRTCLP